MIGGLLRLVFSSVWGGMLRYLLGRTFEKDRGQLAVDSWVVGEIFPVPAVSFPGPAGSPTYNVTVRSMPTE
jgi:hypothetical protein